MEQKEIIFRALAWLASTLIIFPFILGIAEGPGTYGTWGYKAFLVATGFSLAAGIFWFLTDLNIFKDNYK